MLLFCKSVIQQNKAWDGRGIGEDHSSNGNNNHQSTFSHFYNGFNSVITNRIIGYGMQTLINDLQYHQHMEYYYNTGSLRMPINRHIIFITILGNATLAPSKVLVFSWRLLLDRLPMATQLQKCGIIIPNYTCSCSFFKANVEDKNHMFLSCLFS